MIPDGFGRTKITQRLIWKEISMNKFPTLDFTFRKSPFISRHLRFDFMLKHLQKVKRKIDIRCNKLAWMLRKTIAEAMKENLFGSSSKKAAITLIAARETQFNSTANENNASWNLFAFSGGFFSKMDPMISICDWFMKWWGRRRCHSITSWIFPIRKCRRRFPESVVRFMMRESEWKQTHFIDRLCSAQRSSATKLFNCTAKMIYGRTIIDNRN